MPVIFKSYMPQCILVGLSEATVYVAFQLRNSISCWYGIPVFKNLRVSSFIHGEQASIVCVAEDDLKTNEA